ncbi:MAG: PEGA domain-containing protein [Bacteroidota bacterium]|nr:PEGA domain-containing protein [Bacteroidota bacterium]
MKQKHRYAFVALVVLCLISTLLTGCGSTTLIRSVPSGAKVYMNGEPVGVTPYEHYDTKIINSRTNFKLVMDGYKDLDFTLTRNEDLNVGALIGSCFFFPVPLLWIMDYKPIHTYEMTSLTTNRLVPAGSKAPGESKGLDESKFEQLIELKKLLDTNVLTQEEFNIEKKKILAE